MKIFFRADSSVDIGTGHVMRCLVLADLLRARGAEVAFVGRILPGDATALVENQGYRVHRLPLGKDALWQLDAMATRRAVREGVGVADWVVVDHYQLGEPWERSLRVQAHSVMVIDDLADRRHDCDLLLDQNYCDDEEKRYSDLLPARHALLRAEFHAAKRTLRKRYGNVRRVLVFFGGTDPTNETAKALEALASMNSRSFEVDVVEGGGNPFRAAIAETCRGMERVTYHCQVNNMAQLMVNADLALGAGGATTWERCFLGLPTLTVVTAANQRETTDALGRAGVTCNLGWHEDIAAATIADAIRRAIGMPASLVEMGSRAIEVMGGSDGPGQKDLLDLIEQRCRSRAG
jgi:UDP-2,4-diacetamido-2,4,6-trideoxy-beta-L-altropyranose hydrolase